MKQRFTSIFITCYFDEYTMFRLPVNAQDADRASQRTEIVHPPISQRAHSEGEKIAPGGVEKCISIHIRTDATTSFIFLVYAVEQSRVLCALSEIYDSNTRSYKRKRTVRR